MLFSLFYKSKHMSEADEVRCPYNQLGLIVKTLEEKHSRCVVILPESCTEIEITTKVIPQLDLLKKRNIDYTVQCQHIHQVLTVKSLGHSFYLNIPVAEWETFQEFKKLGVSDILIEGPLAFQSKAVSEAKEEIKIRLSPTNPKSIFPKSIESFYVRPEDISYYKFVDIFDFQALNQEQEDALFLTYSKGVFIYDIDNLIPGLPPKHNNLLFKPDFAQKRLNCGQKCKIPYHSCHFCNIYFTLLSLNFS